MATVRGTVVMDLGSGDLPRARALLDEARARSPLARRPGTLVLRDDGRLSFALATGVLEVARVLQAIGIATSVSVTTSLAWGWMFHQALGAGGAIGVAWATAFMILDRRRLRREVRMLGRSLAGLVRSRGEQPR
jgi:hypothetical protein